MRQVATLTVGQLAREHRHARSLALLDLLARLLAALRGLDGEFGQLFSVVHVLVEPELQRGAHVTADQPHGVARVQSLFHLTLELRVQHFGGKHIAGAREHVLGQQLHALGQQRVHLDEGLHGLEQAVAQTAVVGAASAGGDQVDVALAHRRTILGEGHAPGGAFAVGEVVVFRVGEAFALKQRDHRVAAQRLRQVVAQAGLVEPDLGVLGLLVHQGDLHARHQHRLAAQQVGQLAQRQHGRVEILGVGPGAHRGALLAVALALGRDHQRLDHVAGRKRQPGHLSVAETGDLQPRRQRVGHAHADAVQTAGEAVGAALAFVELAARVQAGENQLDHGGLFLGVQAEGNAAPVVFHTHRSIGVQRDLDLLAEPRQRFIGGVVQHFLDDVQRVVGTGVHARPLLDRLQALEDADRAFGIFVGRWGSHGRAL